MISWITARDILATLRRNDRLHGHSFMINIMKDLETALNNKKKTLVISRVTEFWAGVSPQTSNKNEINMPGASERGKFARKSLC